MLVEEQVNSYQQFGLMGLRNILPMVPIWQMEFQ